MSPFREIEHTADWALHVWAPTLEALFEDAARGMYALSGVEAAPAGAWRPFEVSAVDLEALLVSWLQELLYTTEIEGVVFVDFRVEALTPTRLRAAAAEGPAQRPHKVIKAVTYHNLAIRRTADGSGYETTVVFDV